MMFSRNVILTFLSVTTATCSALPSQPPIQLSPGIASPDAFPNASSTIHSPFTKIVNKTTCGNKGFVYQQLAGYGFVPSDARDKFGDTIGGHGSSAAFDRSSWKKIANGSYTGTLYTLPDRGWNTQGTLNYQNRIHKFGITLTLAANATVERPSPPNLEFNYEDSILLTGPDGTPTTGLDADVSGSASYPGFPDLPVATYQGDGYGGSGPGGKRIAVDSEGLVLATDGGFWVSDEYGPYIYKFSATGKMEVAIQPPNAYIPHRNGSVSFSADSPPIYDPKATVIPADTTTGRDNNQGLEGLTASADGKNLYALMQSALDQEGGPKDPARLQARLLEYDISDSNHPVYTHEYVVTLPVYTNADGKEKVAAQSEIHSLGNGQFLVLARDSGAGNGASSASGATASSIYRHADIFDISGSTGATDIKSSDNDKTTGSIASPDKGKLNKGINPATYCPFLDFNVASQLGRFGLHNGGQDPSSSPSSSSTSSSSSSIPFTRLNEKWESLTLVPVDGDRGDDGEWFLFSLSDNDFITQNGYLNFGKYRYQDASGVDVDNQALVFQVMVPKGADVA